MSFDLGALIHAYKGNRSYVELAEDCGGKPTANHLQKLGQVRITRVPDVATLEALARGLRLPVLEVYLAAGRSLGLEVDGGEDLILYGAGELPLRAQAALRDVAAQMLDLQNNVVRQHSRPTAR